MHWWYVRQRLAPVNEWDGKSCASEVAPLLVPCSSCTLLLLMLLAPIPWPWAPATAARQGSACCLPSLSCRPQKQTWLSWHTLEPPGASRPDAGFFSSYTKLLSDKLCWFRPTRHSRGSRNKQISRIPHLYKLIRCIVL